MRRWVGVEGVGEGLGNNGVGAGNGVVGNMITNSSDEPSPMVI